MFLLELVTKSVSPVVYNLYKSGVYTINIDACSVPGRTSVGETVTPNPPEPIINTSNAFPAGETSSVVLARQALHLVTAENPALLNTQLLLSDTRGKIKAQVQKEIFIQASSLSDEDLAYLLNDVLHTNLENVDFLSGYVNLAVLLSSRNNDLHKDLSEYTISNLTNLLNNLDALDERLNKIGFKDKDELFQLFGWVAETLSICAPKDLRVIESITLLKNKMDTYPIPNNLKPAETIRINNAFSRIQTT